MSRGDLCFLKVIDGLNMETSHRAPFLLFLNINLVHKNSNECIPTENPTANTDEIQSKGKSIQGSFVNHAISLFDKSAWLH